MCDGGRENSCTVHTTLVFIVGKVVLLLEHAYYSLVNFIMTVCILSIVIILARVTINTTTVHRSTSF